MTSQVYYDLREQLDQYASGYPATESGVEIRLLEKLFTEEEAFLFLNMSMILEKPEAIAQRLGRDVKQVTALLEGMHKRGLVFRLAKDGSFAYGAVSFAGGIREFQVNNMDREFSDLFEQYFEEAFGKEGLSDNIVLRTIPVMKSINHKWPVVPHEDVRQIIRSKETIGVGPCPCRVQQGLLDQDCGKPLEVCFTFGSRSEFFVDKGMARYVTQEEALRIIDSCEEAGLVSQPYRAQNPDGFCNCCGDCCEMLRAIKMDPKPAEKTISNYFASVDQTRCEACKTCMSRCQMEAIAIGSNNVAEVNLDRCIGCGLCASKCPNEAVSLTPKSPEARQEPPETSRNMMMEMALKRGKSLVPLVVTRGSQT
jgi:electron transport complex protein RnfB